MRFRHVIFDLDGTLIDSLPGIEWSSRQALAACGAGPLSCDLRPLLGPPIRTVLAQATGIAAPHRLDAIERAFRVSYDSEGFRQSVCFPGTLEMLDQLSAAGACLWVATNKNRLATGKILSQLGIRRFFREVACPDSRTPAFSSKAEMLIDLVRRRALVPSECLMVGDKREDAAAARAAQMPCAILAHGYGDIPKAGGNACHGFSGWNALLNFCQPQALPSLASMERVWVNQQ